MRQLFSNNGITLMQNDIVAGATSLSVYPGAGDLFPNPIVGNEFFLVTLENQTATIREIVKVTKRVGDIFTIEKGQEGFDDLNWPNNSIVDCRNTAGTMVNLQNNYNDNYTLEITTGTVTRIFSSEPFQSNTTRLYLGGIRQSLGNDYIEENDGTLQLLNPPQETDVLNGCNITLDFSRKYTNYTA